MSPRSWRNRRATATSEQPCRPVRSRRGRPRRRQAGVGAPVGPCCPREAAVVVLARQAGPALVGLAADVRLGRLALGVQRVERLFQALFGALARVDRAAYGRLGGCGLAGLVHQTASFPSLKKWKPFMCWPVILRATADSDPNTSPSNSTPSSRTLTCNVSPLCSLVMIVPGSGRRGCAPRRTAPA